MSRNSNRATPSITAPLEKALRYLNQSGYVLVFVLWVMTFLVGSAMVFLLSEKLNTRATHTLKAQAIARAAAIRAFSEALNYLLKDKDPQVDFVDEKGILHLDTKTDPFPEKIEYKDSVVEVKITDELSKINISFVPTPILKNILLRLGYEPMRVASMIDSLDDWMDPDSLHRLQGAEDEYYEPLGYTSKNDFLDDIRELTLIKDFGPEVLYGDKDHPPLKPHITVFGRGGLNVNTIKPETLYLLGLSDTEVQSILEARATGGIRIITQELLMTGINRTSSDTFRIKVTARLKGDNTVGYNIDSVIKRYSHKGSYRATVVYWKENEFYTGS